MESHSPEVAGHTLRNRLLGHLAGVAALAATVSLMHPAATEPAPLPHKNLHQAPVENISEVNSSLRVEGNHTYYSNNREYVPVGFSVYGGLMQWNWNWKQVRTSVRTQIIEGHLLGANTERIQASETGLIGNSHGPKGYDARYLAEMKSEVRTINKLGEIAVINDNPQQTDPSEEAPMDSTLHFWRVVAPAFAKNRNIIFDTFNEDYLGGPGSSVAYMSPERARYIWKYGGDVQGKSYVGMQQITNQVEKEAPNHLIWVEPPFWAKHLIGIQRFLIKGKNIVYDLHHVNENTPWRWGRIFGKFAKKHPVVDGELAQYSSPTRTECYKSAYKNLPRLFKYYAKRGIGVIAWSLQKGVLLKDTGGKQSSNSRPESEVSDTINTAINSTRPMNQKALLGDLNTIGPDYGCLNNYTSGEGMGKDFENYTQQNSAPRTPFMPRVARSTPAPFR